MFSQGNVGPHYGPPAPSLPSLSYQQVFPSPPPYQQGLPPPPPYQQGHPTPSSTVPPAHGLVAPTLPIEQGPPPPAHITSPGIMNAGQPYLYQCPSVHGNSLVPPPYQASQQASQYMPPVSSHNVNHLVPSVPQAFPGPSQLHPRVLPPPPPTGQMSYTALPPLPLQGPQPVRPLPPPPRSAFVPVTPASYASFVPGSSVDAQPPSMPLLPPPPPLPPLPPCSPPPLPPSSPPPSSPTDAAVIDSGFSFKTTSDPAKEVPHHVDSDFSSDKMSESEERTIDLVDGEVGRTGEMDSSRPGGTPSKSDALFNLPSPPMKPVEAEVVRNIEILCQFIAKVGPDFENMARIKEADNPKFAFLFGGEPGSAAAIGHEYFLWMKKKCDLEFKLQSEQQQNDPVSRSIEVEASVRSGSVDGALSVSPASSDMDMEDDVSQPEKVEGLCQQAEDTIDVAVLLDNVTPVARDHVLSSQSSVKPQPEDANLETFYSNGTSQQIAVQGKDIDQSSFMSLQTEELSTAKITPEKNELALRMGSQEPGKSPLVDLSPVKVPSATAAGQNDVVPRVVVKDTSPFRLIQGYASDESADDDRLVSMEDVSPVRDSVGDLMGTSYLHEDKRTNLFLDIESKGVSGVETRLKVESVVAAGVNRSDGFVSSHQVVSETVGLVNPSDAGTKSDEPSVCRNENTSITSEMQSSPLENVVSSEDMSNDPQSGQVLKEESVKQASTNLNVDEFGRLVREGASDTDSDDMHFSQRSGKRGRSPSPQERKRRRSRSPRWRRDRRSRSRSWSPKKWRSRSRSPLTFIRMGELSSDKMRRENRSHPPECLDFLRGKCFRGASCKYLHHDSASNDALRRFKKKKEQHHEPSLELRNASIHGDVHPVAEAHDDKNTETGLVYDRHGLLVDKGRNQDIQIRQDLLSSVESGKDMGLDEKIETNAVKDGVRPTTSSEIDQPLVAVVDDIIPQSQGNQEVDALVTAMKVGGVAGDQSIHCRDKGEPTAETKHFPGDGFACECPSGTSAAEPTTSTTSSLVAQEFLSEAPHSLHVGGTSTSLSSPIEVDGSQSLQTESLRPSVLHQPNFSAIGQQFQSSRPSMASFPLPECNLSASHALRPPDQNLLQLPVASLQPQLSAANYCSQNVSLAKASWNDTLPSPPPSFVNETIPRPTMSSVDFHLSHFCQTSMPARVGLSAPPLMRSYPSEEQAHPRVLGFQHHAFPYMAEPLRPPLHMEEFRAKPLEADNTWDRSFWHTGRWSEEQFVRATVPPSSEFIPKPSHDFNIYHQLHGKGHLFDAESVHSQPPFFPRDHASMHQQSFSVDSQPPFPGENFSSPAKIFSLSRQQSSYASQLPAVGSFYSHGGVSGNLDSSLSRHPSGLADVGPKVLTSTHYNPFASTFEQIPSGSKYDSNVLRSEVDSNYCSKLGKEMRTGDQYDPLFDSIEPSSKMVRKFDAFSERSLVIKDTSGTGVLRAADDTVSSLKLSSSIPLDVEENNKQKDGVVPIVKSVENEDFDGATTDAEIGIVENASPRPGEGKSWSPMIPNDPANTGAGEIEIDQVQTSGKSKSKDSRSMKLFKIAIADFVKEVLKPSWRQGNMSKEAFKTIVKKTVDKVSGAMQNHQIPKSQAKINQYVESSQRKLTKLVMGYVDKYVKV